MDIFEKNVGKFRFCIYASDFPLSGKSLISQYFRNTFLLLRCVKIKQHWFLKNLDGDIRVPMDSVFIDFQYSLSSVSTPVGQLSRGNAFL